jgi:hypothetical protein
MTDPSPLQVLPTVDTSGRGSAILDMGLDMGLVCRRRVSHLRYEGFAADPFAKLDCVSTEPGVPVSRNRIADEFVTLEPNHLAGGNPVRFRRDVTTRSEDEWTAAMPRPVKLPVGATMTPLLLKHGYSLSGPPSEARR